MRPLILICIALYALAMAGWSFVVHRIVGYFGWFGGLVTIRQARKKIEILSPLSQNKVDAE
jgi:hypothetical protein